MAKQCPLCEDPWTLTSFLSAECEAEFIRSSHILTKSHRTPWKAIWNAYLCRRTVWGQMFPNWYWTISYRPDVLAMGVCFEHCMASNHTIALWITNSDIIAG